MKQKYILCPVCGKHKFPTWEDNGTCVCPYCGWAHDSLSEDESFEAGSHNDLCLDNYKLRYEYYVEQNPDYHWARDKYPDIPQIEKSICPVCGKFQFEPITWEDICCGIVPSDIYCMDCGWHYDVHQRENPNLSNGANTMSLNEYKAWYAQKVKDNPEYSFFEEQTENYVPTPHKCPVCAKYDFKDECCHDICPFCGWEDDGTDDGSESLGANDLRFSLYKERYNGCVKRNPEYRWDKDIK